MSEIELHHKNEGSENQFIDEVKAILTNARHKAYSMAHAVMVDAYWHIGKRIVEQEQNGKERAGYGKQLLKRLSGELTQEFDKGLDERELRRIRQFYSLFPIRDALRPELTWSHYRSLIRVQNVARYSILKENEQLFASKYKLYLPTEKELALEIEREKKILQEKLNDSKSIDQ